MHIREICTKILAWEGVKMKLYKKLQFSDLGDERGKLVVVEGNIDIPFTIQRAFYMYGSDSDVVRGKHANINSEFVLINVAGSSKILITDGNTKEIVSLSKPMEGVYIPKMIWKEMYDFSKDSVLLVLASTHYDKQEYLRDYAQYTMLMDFFKEKKDD